MTIKDTTIISAFPGVGKSHFYNNSAEDILDSDSSRFDKSKFPQNYIDHIKANIGEVSYILVSSHKLVRDALVENNIPFLLMYPHSTLKNEYIQRYKDRGNAEAFVELLEKNWDVWIEELDKQEGCIKIVLQSGDYLSDYLIHAEYKEYNNL